MQRALLICVFAPFASLVAAPAHADLILRIADGTTTVNINDIGDLNPTVGVVAWSVGVGVWNINMPTGVGFPVLDQAHLDLNSLNINSTGTGTLDILFTQTNVTAPISTWTMNFGETLNGSPGSTTTYMAWRDSTNAQFPFGFDAANLIGTVGPFGIGPNSGSVMGTVAGTTPYTLTERIRIVATGPTIFSGDAELIPSAVPEPGTLTLLGTGLFGIAQAARRRMRKGSGS